MERGKRDEWREEEKGMERLIKGERWTTKVRGGHGLWTKTTRLKRGRAEGREKEWRGP